MTTETMTMNLIDDGADRGIAPPEPLFASSWMALYRLLWREYEAYRREAGPRHGDAEADEEARTETD